MRFKYYIQKYFGRLLKEPLFLKGKTVGYSLVRSEKARCSMGSHTKVYPPFFLHDMSLNDYSYIAKNANISHCTIGKFCSIGPNFCCGLGIHPIDGISTAPMFYSTAKQNGMTLCEENMVQEFASTTIGNDVFIGANVTVLDGVSIGDGAVIGAGAVVVDDIPPFAVAVGVPAKVIKYRFDKETIVSLLARKWWDDSEDRLSTIAQSFWNVNGFLQQK